MPSSSPEALANKRRRRTMARELIKKKKIAEHPLIKTLTNEALANQRAAILKSVAVHKKRYDSRLALKQRELDDKTEADARIHAYRERVSGLRIDGLLKEVRKLRADNSVLTCKNKQLQDELTAANGAIKEWKKLWGWIKAHARAPTWNWLQRLKRDGPPKARDRGWGGGQ